MNISSRLMAPIAIQDRDNKVVSVDLEAFVTRLLLFDTYILQSIWLEDLILLQHSFGTAGLSQLFESGALQFQCDVFVIAQTGQLSGLGSEHSKLGLPPFNYQFSVLRVQGEDEKIDRTLAAFDAGLRTRLLGGRVRIPASFSKTVFDAVYRDMKSDLLDSALQIELRRLGIIPVSHQLQIEKRGEDEFKVENDLSRRYLLPEFEAHRLIEKAMMAVAGLDQRIASMQAHSALTGLSEGDKALLEAKVGLLANLAVTPASPEQQFSRVATLKGLPVPKFGSSVIDVKALLKVRESDECRAFKQWLAGSEALSDKELRERVAGFSRKIRQAVHSTTGKAVRFLISTGLGSISLPVGLVAGVVDTFLLERLIPKDAILSFLSDSYPSLFKSNIKR